MPSYAYGGYDPFAYGYWQRSGFGYSWYDPMPWSSYTFHNGYWTYLDDRNRWAWVAQRRDMRQRAARATHQLDHALDGPRTDRGSTHPVGRPNADEAERRAEAASSGLGRRIDADRRPVLQRTVDQLKSQQKRFDAASERPGTAKRSGVTGQFDAGDPAGAACDYQQFQQLQQFGRVTRDRDFECGQGRSLEAAGSLTRAAVVVVDRPAMRPNQAITPYASIGTMNALCSPPESARRPASGGNRAPPMIAMQSTPDVDSREAVERSSVTVKMTGNMIELKNPTDSAATAATEPRPCITVRQRATATAAAPASTRVGDSRVRSRLPANRPTIAPPQ